MEKKATRLEIEISGGHSASTKVLEGGSVLKLQIVRDDENVKPSIKVKAKDVYVIFTE